MVGHFDVTCDGRRFLVVTVRARQEIRCTFCCWPPGPLARRERRAYPVRYVRSEQHRQGACGPQPGGARRRAGICFVAAPRICPPGARAKIHTLFPDGPLEVNSRPYRTDAAREKKIAAPAGPFAGWKPALHFFGLAIADCGFEIYGKVRS